MVAQSAQITTNQVTPFGSFVLVSYEKHEEETTDGGIIIPATEGSQFKIMDGIVHRVGAVVEKDDFIHNGDVVILPSDMIGIDMTDRIETLLQDRVFRIVAVENIIAVIG